jgi:hypothetical protein
MFFHKPSLTPTKTKKIIYLISWVVLGVLLSFLAHAFIEFKYLSWADENNRVVVWYGGCALHPVLRVGLFMAGVLFGFWQGKFWWQKIYIERYWEKKFTK